MTAMDQAAGASTAAGRPGLAVDTCSNAPGSNAPAGSGFCPGAWPPVLRADSDAAGVDRFVDDQAVGDPFEEEFVRPERPRWRQFGEWLQEGGV